MITPNVWGQGQLFAFSALDGKSMISDDFVGILSGDKIGIRFFSKTKRELILTAKTFFAPQFKTVASDIITFQTETGEINIIYADTHLIVGNTAKPYSPFVLTEGEVVTENHGDIQIQNTLDGDYTAILHKNGKFAFAFGHSKEEVIALVDKGIELDVETEKAKKLEIYEKFTVKEEKYQRLYAKCLSVMKSQLYSPEGRYTKIWSTPDRLPHVNLWLWDSVFHSVGYRNINPTLAEDLILDIFEGQTENGFIPHSANLQTISRITQPMVIGWGSYLVYQKSGNKEFLKTVFEHNKKFLEWCHENRRQSETYLYTWLTTNEETCRCDECGMDNSPRFDKKTYLEAIDFSCFMANDCRYMAKIAAELGDTQGEKYFTEWYNNIKTAVNDKLWSEEDGFYFDYDILDKKLHKVWSVASFLPLLAGICDGKRAEKLVSQLKNPKTFGTPFPVPCISKEDPSYGSDMWRGPVWLNYNYMIISGLKEYGFCDLAQELTDKTVDVVNEWYLRTGTVYEFYDPENASAPKELNRKGKVFEPYSIDVKFQSVRDYGWTATICLDLLN